MGENPIPYREYGNGGNIKINKTNEITTSVTRPPINDVPQKEEAYSLINKGKYSKDRSTTRPIAEKLLGKKAGLIEEEFYKNNKKYPGGIDLPKEKFEDRYKGNA